MAMKATAINRARMAMVHSDRVGYTHANNHKWGPTTQHVYRMHAGT